MSREIVHGRTVRVTAWAVRQDDFTVHEAAEAHGMTLDNAAQLLGRMTRKGLLYRIERGTYRATRMLFAGEWTLDGR